MAMTGVSAPRVLAVVCTSLVVSGCTSLPDVSSASRSEESVVEELLSITEAYNDIWEELDYDGIAEYHASDFTYYRRGVVDTESQDDFARSFNENVATQITAYWSDASEISVDLIGSDAGLVAFLFRGGVRLPDGTEVPYDGALTYVWERREGRWQLVHIHESAYLPDSE